MIIRKLIVRNFRSIEEISLSFPEKGGIYLITGKNLDDTPLYTDSSLVSNGVGKTSLFGSIFYALYHVSLWSKTLSSLVRKGAEDLYVDLEFELEGDIIRVISTLNTYELYINGELRASESVTSVKNELINLLGLSARAFGKSVFISEDWESFVDLSPSERLKILGELFGLKLFLDGAKKASDYKKRVENNLSKVRQEKAYLEGALAQYEDSYVDKIEKFEQERAEKLRLLQQQYDMIVKTIEDEMEKFDELKKKEKQLEEFDVGELSALKKQIQQVEREYETISAQLNEISIKMEVTQKEKKRLENELTIFKDGTCPTCKRVIEGEDYNKLIMPKKKEIQKLDRILKQCFQDFDKFSEQQRKVGLKLKELKSEYDKKLAKSMQVSDLRASLKQRLANLKKNFEAWKTQAQGIKKQIEEWQNMPNPYELEEKQRVAEVNKINSKLIKVNDKERTLLSAYDCSEFWSKEFKNIHLQLFSDLLNEFAVLVNKHLQDFEFKHSIDFEIIKSSKKQLEKLELVFDKDFTFMSLSGGEKQLVRLAFSFAVSELLQHKIGKKFRLLLLDEPLKGLDVSKQLKIAEKLKEFAKDKQVFVVTHSSDFAKLFNNRIVLVKKDGKTTLESFEFEDLPKP